LPFIFFSRAPEAEEISKSLIIGWVSHPRGSALYWWTLGGDEPARKIGSRLCFALGANAATACAVKIVRGAHRYCLSASYLFHGPCGPNPASALSAA